MLEAIRFFTLAVCYLLASSAVIQSTTRAAFDPTDGYEVREVEGWKVYVNKRLTDAEPKLAGDALRLLETQLYDVGRRVPEGAIEKLRQIPIWLELCDPNHPCAAYHPSAEWLRENGMNPDKARSVEIANAKTFLAWTKQQPMMVLHELAHGYHHQFLEGGNENAEVAEAFAHANAAGLYDEVLHYAGKPKRAYAMSNPMEYFAETSEAFFGTNDFYPFVAAELKQHDPRMHSLLEKVWGASLSQ